MCFIRVQTAVKDSGEESWLVKTWCLLPSRVATNSAEASQRYLAVTSFCRVFSQHSDGDQECHREVGDMSQSLMPDHITGPGGTCITLVRISSLQWG